MTHVVLLFQSTHPRGVRLEQHPPAFSHQDFNPRTREGCDPFSRVNLIPAPVFQSTHPRGVRHAFYAYNIVVKRFQSTHPRGVRPIISLSHLGLFIFQSTHPRGVRQQTQPIACLSLLLYYSIFYRILQASDTYKTRKRQKNLKIRCETPGNFMFAQGSHLF